MEYDVVVVGAGPAGSTAAKCLAEKGVKVLLIDKNKFPRDKPCGGGIPVRVLKRFKYIEEKNLIESYSYGGCAYSSSLKYKLKLQKNEPLLAMILRKKFDYGLVKLATDCGTVFLDGKSAKDIKILDDRAKIIVNNGTNIESEIVIGADGIWSTIAKKSGLSTNGKKGGICLFQEYPMHNKTLNQYFSEKRLFHIHLGILGMAGYGWVFPKRNKVNIGIVEFQQAVDPLKRKINLKEVYKDYIKILKESKIIPNSLKMERIRGAELPVGPLGKTFSSRIILCGDAGGLINPATGEGIYHAMSSGEIAAKVITEALEAGDTQKKFLSKYETLWKNDFGKDIRIFLGASKQWGKDTEKAVRLASKDKKFTEMALEVVTGNLSFQKCKWKLVRRLLYVYFKDIFGVV